MSDAVENLPRTSFNPTRNLTNSRGLVPFHPCSTMKILLPLLLLPVLLAPLQHVAAAGTRAARQNESRKISESDDEATKFKENSGLKNDANIVIEKVAPGQHFMKIGDLTINLHDLKPISHYADGFTSSLDGVPETGPPAVALYGLEIGPNKVRVVKNASGQITTAFMINTETGERFGAAQVDEGTDHLAIYSGNDIDDELLKKYSYGDPSSLHIPNRQLSKATSVQRDLDVPNQCDNPSSRRILQVAIAYESGFCNTYGGEAGATARVNAIVDYANIRYDSEGLCIQLELTYIDKICDSSSDPYSSIVGRTEVCSNGSGVLGGFRSDWLNRMQGITRDSAHLFMDKRGTDPDGTIGCAYISALCSSYGFGVNDMTYEHPQATILDLQVSSSSVSVVLLVVVRLTPCLCTYDRRFCLLMNSDTTRVPITIQVPETSCRRSFAEQIATSSVSLRSIRSTRS